MDKRTIIAIAISAVLFIGYILLSTFVFKPQTKPETTKTETKTDKPAEEKPAAVKAVKPPKEIQEAASSLPQTPSASTKLKVSFSNKGAVVTSIKLNDAEADPSNKRADDDIEMVFASRAKTPAPPAAEYPFSMHFGAFDAPAVTDLFEMKVISDQKIEFTRDFEIETPVPGKDKPEMKRVKVIKTFELVPNQYVLLLKIRVESVPMGAGDIPFNFKGLYYTLGIGPQIGPEFPDAVPDERSDFRRFVVFGNERKEYTVGRGSKPQVVTDKFSWASVMGKYYALIVWAKADIRDLVFDSRDISLPYQRSALYLERSREQTPGKTDEYLFYFGPKKREILNAVSVLDENKVDIAKNLKFGELMPMSFLFGWIAEVLKYPLDFFARVGNYGVAIIILTLLIKILLYPLTRKSFDSMKKMQAVSPKLKELREKYKDNPKRLNAEMAELYKREGISPLGGCLPMLLQLPIMFALYELFNTHFALKGAVFIPGWIPDLSVAESIWKLPFAPINILGFTLSDLRLLPFIMLATQFATTFFTQGQSSGGDNKMKYLPYVLMVVFFFILYNLPSGLVLYWTMQNIFTVLQMFLQKFLSERKERTRAAA